MALDGLQKLLEDNFPWESKKGSTGWYCPKVRLVRFADDFIITGESKELLEHKVKPLVASFLAERGLTLSEEKTLITLIDDGFDFLGFNVRKFNGTLLTRPAKDCVKRMLDKVKREIHRSRGTSQHELIMRLNPILKGWANYYQYSAASETFRKADYLIFKKLWRWGIRRHGNKNRTWIKQRYFHKIGNRDWVFATTKNDSKGEEYFVPLTILFNTKIQTYPQLKCGLNPFDPEWMEYRDKRRTVKMKMSMSGKRTLFNIWKRQNQRCPICGEPITVETPWHTMMSTAKGKNTLSIVHESCYLSVTHKKKCKNERVSE